MIITDSFINGLLSIQTLISMLISIILIFIGWYINKKMNIRDKNNDIISRVNDMHNYLDEAYWLKIEHLLYLLYEEFNDDYYSEMNDRDKIRISAWVLDLYTDLEYLEAVLDASADDPLYIRKGEHMLSDKALKRALFEVSSLQKGVARAFRLGLYLSSNADDRLSEDFYILNARDDADGYLSDIILKFNKYKKNRNDYILNKEDFIYDTRFVYGDTMRSKNELDKSIIDTNHDFIKSMTRQK